MAEFTLAIIVNPEGGYIAGWSEYPESMTQADTLWDALLNAAVTLGRRIEQEAIKEVEVGG
jgi:predicted RNase H-like HicB family nuclease